MHENRQEVTQDLDIFLRSRCSHGAVPPCCQVVCAILGARRHSEAATKRSAGLVATAEPVRRGGMFCMVCRGVCPQTQYGYAAADSRPYTRLRRASFALAFNSQLLTLNYQLPSWARM